MLISPVEHVFFDGLMPNSEEDSYSMIFASLKHPIRRRILRILSDEPESFSDLQKQFKIESSHLTYHLEGLGNLLYKTEDGKYALSSFGDAAVSMMKQVEEPPRTSLHLSFPSSRRIRMLKPLTFLLVCGLIASLIFNGVFFFRYTELERTYDGLNKAYFSHMPPVSQSLTTQIALDHGGWDETTLKGMEVSATLWHIVFWSAGDDWSHLILGPANETLSDYDPVTIGNSTYRYAWTVIVEQAEGMRSIPPPGFYFVDASTGEILPTGNFPG